MIKPLEIERIQARALAMIARGITAQACNVALPKLEAMISEEARYEAAAMRCAMKVLHVRG